MNRKGYALVIVLAALVLLVAAGGIWYYEMDVRPVSVPGTVNKTSASNFSLATSSAATSSTGLSTTTAKVNGGDDRSFLNLDSEENEILLIDPLGNRTGYDSVTGMILQGIASSTYATDALGSAEDPSYVPPPLYSIDVDHPAEGNYKLIITVGPKSDSYDVEMTSYAADGSRRPDSELKGSTTPGGEITFQINFVSTPNGTSTIQLVE